MMNILTILKNILGGLFSSGHGTNGSSQAGSGVSTGNGVSNVLVLVLVGLLCAGSFYIGRLTSPEKVCPETVVSPGVPDTIYVPSPPTTGTDNTSGPVYTASLDTIYCVAVMPAYVDNEVVIHDSSFDANIRATAYPYIENDTLKIDLPIEYNIQPKPIQHITLHDTIPVPVPVPVDVPWIEQPEVVAGGVSIFWLLLGVILI